MQTSDFDYLLPKVRIAQSPANPRESAKLMILDRKTGKFTHQHISDFPSYLQKGDVLVVNNTKVFKARLIGTIATPDGDKNVELFLVRPTTDGQWLALAKPGKKLLVGSTITLGSTDKAMVTGKNSDGTILVTFTLTDENVINLANHIGHVPVPPYIDNEPDEKDYQTVYAKITGSVAAPTAGFHLTEDLFTKIKNKGITVVEITLHVGLGTFLPIKSDTLETHAMHSEWVDVSKDAATIIQNAKKEHRRIVAVGTTTVRTLEGIAAQNHGVLVPYQGDVNLFISPGFAFQVIDALLTNFHLPKSTLIVLISAFAGRKHILTAYNEAVSQKYRFYSFGDAMFIA